MSSSQGTEMGLKRGSDLWKESPDKFTVLGADISADDLKKRFTNNEWARNVIDAIACERGKRAKDVDESFWKLLRGGVTTPINFVFFKEDDFGEAWLVVIAGQHRVVGLRKMNSVLLEEGAAPLEIQGKAERLPRDKAGVEAAIRALAIRTNENQRVPLRPSDQADLALKHSNNGMSIADIAASICVRAEMAEKDVPAYLALSECEPEVRQAVDDGLLPIARCVRLVKKTAAQQREAVAPKESKPREKRRTLPGEFATAFAAALPAKYDAAQAALLFMAGDLKALDGYPSLKDAASKAGIDFETGRVRRAEA